jgi:hypothetical protein
MRIPLLLTVVLAIAIPAHADECIPTTSVTGDDMIVVEFPRNGLLDYLAIDVCQPGCIFSIWTYFEANETPGLQRADEFRDDTCGGLIGSDFIWF